MDYKKTSEAFAEVMQMGLSQEETRQAIAVKIVKTISDDFQQEDISGMLLPKEYVPLGQTAEFKVPGKLKAYWHEPGSYAPRTRMINKVFTVSTEMLSANPEYEIDLLEAGRFGSMQDQISAAKDALLGANNALVWNTLRGSITSGKDNYGTSSGALTKAAIDGALNWVEDQIGGAVAIVGRRNILYKMLDWNYGATGGLGMYSDEEIKSINAGGKIATYRGVPIIGLKQWRDGFGKLTIAEDCVLIIGKDVGKYVVSQELKSKEAIDVDTLIWNIHLYMRVGCAVFFPERMYRIQIVP